MRYVLLALTLFFTFAPLTTQAAFEFVQIVPDVCDCEDVPVEGEGSVERSPSAPAWGCVLQVIQNVIRVAIALGIVVATFALIYASFVWMTSGGSAERRNQGSHLLINVFIGLGVMMGAWLIVDFVMKELYREPTEFGPWNNILGGSAADGSARYCIVARAPQPIASGTVSIVTGPPGSVGGGASSTMPPDPNADNSFSYQSGIERQASHASAALNSVISCMAARVPASVGQISSISDSRIISGSRTFAQCAQSGSCGHAAYSCHYGGRSCTGQSYAVDFGDEQNWRVLERAALSCGASRVYHPGNDPDGHGDHVHVSVQGGTCGCN